MRTFTRTKRPPRRKRRERTKNGCVAVPCLLRALEVEEREETGEEEEEEEETAAICDDDLKEKEKEKEKERERDLFVTRLFIITTTTKKDTTL